LNTRKVNTDECAELENISLVEEMYYQVFYVWYFPFAEWFTEYLFCHI